MCECANYLFDGAKKRICVFSTSDFPNSTVFESDFFFGVCALFFFDGIVFGNQSNSNSMVSIADICRTFKGKGSSTKEDEFNSKFVLSKNGSNDVDIH